MMMFAEDRFVRIGFGLLGRRLDRDEQSFEVQLGNRRKRREIFERRRIDHRHQISFAVKEFENSVEFVRNFVEPFDEDVGTDLENRVERRQGFAKTTPLVHAPHALHQQSLRGTADDFGHLDFAEFDLEIAFVPKQDAIDGFFAGEFSQDRVDDFAVAEIDVGLLPVVVNVNDARFATHLERLQQIDDPHVGDETRKTRPSTQRALLLGCEAISRITGEKNVDAGNQLANEDRLRQIIFDTQFEAADFVFDRLLTREKNDGNRRPISILLDAAHESVPIEVREARVRQDQVRRRKFDLRKRVVAIERCRNAEASLFEAYFEQTQAARVGVDKEELLFCHEQVSGKNGEPGLGMSSKHDGALVRLCARSF